MTDDNIPRVINPDYLVHEYLTAVGEMEELLGALRNADDEGRLAIIEGTLAESDKWLDYRYNAVGMTPEKRAEADLIYARITDILQGQGGLILSDDELEDDEDPFFLS